MKSEDSRGFRIVILLEEISAKMGKLLRLIEFTQKDAILRRKKEVLVSSTIRREVYELCNGERTVTEIARILGQKTPNISEQLAILESTGLITSKRRGRYKYYVKIL